MFNPSLIYLFICGTKFCEIIIGRRSFIFKSDMRYDIINFYYYYYFNIISFLNTISNYRIDI